MLEIVDTDRTNGIIEIDFGGSINIEEITKFLHKLIDIMRENKCWKIYAQSNNLIGDYTTFDYLQIFKLFNQISFPRDFRIAVVNLHGITDNMKFFENIAVNHNWYVKVFDDEELAFHWLKSDSQ